MVLQGKDQPPKRACVFAFYDKHGVVDRYIPALLSSLRPFCEKLLIVVNGPLSPAGKDAFESLGAQLLQRENGGFDIAGYKAGILQLLSEEALWDEVIFLNQTVFGPIYPLEEMFKKMDARDLDFWGITKHPGFAKDPWGTAGGGAVPAHIQSYFVAVRKKMLYTTAFLQYWKELPIAETYYDAVGGHEMRFTKHFEDLGFQSGVYIDPKELLIYDDYPLMHHSYPVSVDYRCPFIKRKGFFTVKEEFLLWNSGGHTGKVVQWLEQNRPAILEMALENLLRTEDAYLVYLNSGTVWQKVETVAEKTYLYVLDNPEAEALAHHFAQRPATWVFFENEGVQARFLSIARTPLHHGIGTLQKLWQMAGKETGPVAFYTNVWRLLTTNPNPYPDRATLEIGLAAADAAPALEKESSAQVMLPLPTIHERGVSISYAYEEVKEKLASYAEKWGYNLQNTTALFPSFSRCFAAAPAVFEKLGEAISVGFRLDAEEVAYLPCLAAAAMAKRCIFFVPGEQAAAYLLGERYMLDGYSRVFATEQKRVYPSILFRMQAIKEVFDDRRYEMTLRDAFKGNLSFKQKMWIALQLFLSPGAFERVRYLLSGGKPPAPPVHEKSDID